MAARMVERLTSKTEVYVTICSNGWCQVSVGTHSGYVPRRFLVKRAAPPPPAVRSPAPRSDSLGWEPPPATSQDMWQVVHSMKGMSHYTILQVDAVAPVRGPLREFRPSLHILCDTAGLSVYLMTSAVLLADTRHTPVRVFWGGTRSPPPPTPWILSREHSAAFVPGTTLSERSSAIPISASSFGWSTKEREPRASTRAACAITFQSWRRSARASRGSPGRRGTAGRIASTACTWRRRWTKFPN